MFTNKSLFSNPLIKPLPAEGLAPKVLESEKKCSMVSENTCNSNNALKTKKDARDSPEIIIGSLFDAKGNEKFK